MKLDVGCGGSERFKSHSVRGDVNVDIHKPTCKMPNFILCDAEHLPFKSEVFNKILMMDVIEHLDAVGNSLKEAHRVLTSNGILIVGTPNALYLPKVLRGMFKGDYVASEDHIQTWGKFELANLFRRVGFNVKIEYRTYLQSYQFYHKLMRFVPFASVKHRQLFAVASKNHG